MKNVQNKLIVLFLMALALPHLASSQEGSTYELAYDVHRIYPPLCLTKGELKEAATLLDLNKYYDAEWVKEYISVEVLTTYKGSTRKAVSKNEVLSQEQKNMMKMADVGTDITVKVRYLPENNLTHNDIKEMNFKFSVDPESEAAYPGGQQALKKYLKEKIIDKIPAGSIRQYQLTAVKFTINEEGEITNPHTFWTSEDEKIDALMLETIRNMPCWKPAEYANGLKVKQEFALTVGDMESCVVNMINIRQD